MKGYHVAQARPGDKVTTKPDVKKTKQKKQKKYLLRTDVVFRLGLFHFTFNVYHGCGNLLVSHK